MLSGSTSPADNQDLSTNQQAPEILINSSDLLALLKELAVITKAFPKLMETLPKIKNATTAIDKLALLIEDLLLIQESHPQKQDKFYLANFDCFKNDRDNPLYIRAARGTVIFMKRHLPYHQIPTPPLQHIEVTVISLKLPNLDPIIIASIYVPVTSDPQLFTLELKKKHAPPLPIINSANSLDLEIRNFTDDLLASHRNVSKPYNNRNNWIPPNVKKLIKIRNNAKKNWQILRNLYDKTILNRINKNIKQAFKNYSDKLWKEKLEDLQIDDGSFWNLIKNFKSSKTKIPHLNSTISTAIKDLDKVELNAQKLEKQPIIKATNNPISDSVHENTVMQTINNFYQNNSDDIIPPDSPSDIIIIIQNMKTKSAPGLDSISNKILKKLPIITIIKLCYLINKVLELKHFLDS
ncbi:RNA-directed DNA polymerase from mobile element jockey [Caerostris darwini]|uniref:RNA-directed DNA polymerase from mobile element jockey n=1 Tax=Caerostris darwini TaxID=1538125 RepID=A0AAV4S3K1_9ARAC|nr:RNA-directed DNA polymerase from mobile element jockey [Caerostris darwini]